VLQLLFHVVRALDQFLATAYELPGVLLDLGSVPLSTHLFLGLGMLMSGALQVVELPFHRLDVPMQRVQLGAKNTGLFAHLATVFVEPRFCPPRLREELLQHALQDVSLPGQGQFLLLAMLAHVHFFPFLRFPPFGANRSTLREGSADGSEEGQQTDRQGPFRSGSWVSTLVFYDSANSRFHSLLLSHDCWQKCQLSLWREFQQ
jgi:hypothetical protein